MSLPRTITRIFLPMWLMSCVASAQAGAIPWYVQKEIADARLVGQGSYSWFGLTIYEAYLWGERETYRPESPMADRFVLELVYQRELKGVRIAETSISEIRKLGFGTSAQLDVWLKMMQDIFPDVRKGTKLSGVYLPGQGARFYMDGQLLKEIPDPEFARAFFSIWLDERTSAARLRSRLLGLKT